ncbi:hypothetical protein [Actinoplanes derwentensis]|uniref:Uncharacterized protein n=1 Tax=Actinoplanes derwentensis TaxID=113562 RepID=A0A1H2C9Z7_9ACTN|nr:hypothetical protein [Actinoplanes derwentensis]GID89078.1 hypothetical protein Ade03nite_80020 [Actinoplanes derwentensis]SDT67231.1 hypothetical protein SAMN04489716_5445 [Actinoplanes derwentensis]
MTATPGGEGSHRPPRPRYQSDLGEAMRVQLKPIKAIAQNQSEHTQTLAKHTAMFEKVTATLDRHTAMHKEHGLALSGLTIDMHLAKDRDEQIIGLLHTLIDREDGR